MAIIVSKCSDTAPYTIFKAINSVNIILIYIALLTSCILS